MTSGLDLHASFDTTPAMVMRAYRTSHAATMRLRLIAAATCLAAGIVNRSVVALTLAVALLVLSELAVRAELRPALRQPRAVSVHINAHGVGCSGIDGRPTSQAWSGLRSADLRDGLWVLTSAEGGAPVVVPEAALDHEQRAAFEQLLREQDLIH